MAKSDGFLKVQRTKILPLRWIGNACGSIATNSLVKAWHLDEDNNLGYRFKFHCKVWMYLSNPYMLWGTYYELTDGDSLES